MLNGMAKMMGAFNKNGSQAMQPTVTTRYIKGNRMRTDYEDGCIQMIDLDARRIIEICPAQKVYGVVSFDQMKSAVQMMQQAMEQNPDLKNSSLTVKPSVSVAVQPGTRVIRGQTANEVRVRVDTEMQVKTAGAADQPGDPQQPQHASGTVAMRFDLWIAPGVTSYQEFSEFHRKMAQELKWTPPSSLRLDPRAQQGIAELQNSDAVAMDFRWLNM
jgi:hypothetical protein